MNKLPPCSYVESQLAEIAGSTRETLYRLERLGAPKAQDRLRQMLKITSRATKRAGGDKRAIAWFCAQSLPALGGGTAEALVKDGKAVTLGHTALGGVARGLLGSPSRSRSPLVVQAHFGRRL